MILQKTVLPKDVGEYDSVAEFLDSCKSRHTSKGYKTALTKFFNFAAAEKSGFNPDVAIKLKSEELNPLILKYAQHLKKIAKTSEEIRRGEVNVNSVAYYINAVKVFFDYNEITLAWKKIKRFLPERIVRKYHVYDRDEIRKLLAVANHRERAIILILVSSGMRAEALVRLQIRDFEIQEENIGHFVVYARTPSYYHTFCTPECTAAIRFYLDWRKEMGEVEKGEDLRPESPLIRDNIKDAFAKDTKHPRPISYMRLWEIMQKLLRKAGISSSNNYSLQPNHSFRKFMNTAVANAKANPLFKEIMLGHSLNLDNTYYDRDDPQSLRVLLEEYSKAVDALTVDPKYLLQKQLAKVQGENEVLKIRVNDTDIIVSKFELLKSEFENVAKVATDSQRRADEAEKQIAELKAQLAHKKD